MTEHKRPSFVQLLLSVLCDDELDHMSSWMLLFVLFDRICCLTLSSAYLYI